MDIGPARAPSEFKIPHFNLKKDKHGSSIQVGKWSITATKRPILSGKEIEAAEKRLHLPLPEMTFGKNSLFLEYDPDPSSCTAGPSHSTPARQPAASSATTHPKQALRFDAMEALEGVATGEGWEDRIGGGVKVSMADQWTKSRRSSSLLSDQPLPSKPVRPHDWTYSTCYSGSEAGPSTFALSSSHAIPMELLARRDPVLDQILYYEDIALFEDELHDHGESIFNVRIRVMPHSLFILARLFVRVDNVLFRIHDTRVYHAFDSDEIIREVSGMEADYDDVKSCLIKLDDLSPLTDQNWVSEVMTSISSKKKEVELQHEDTTKPWPGLGRRVEVLKLSENVDDTQSLRDRLEKIKWWRSVDPSSA